MFKFSNSFMYQITVYTYLYTTTVIRSIFSIRAVIILNQKHIVCRNICIEMCFLEAKHIKFQEIVFYVNKLISYTTNIGMEYR